MTLELQAHVLIRFHATEPAQRSRVDLGRDDRTARVVLLDLADDQVGYHELAPGVDLSLDLATSTARRLEVVSGTVQVSAPFDRHVCTIEKGSSIRLIPSAVPAERLRSDELARTIDTLPTDRDAARGDRLTSGPDA